MTFVVKSRGDRSATIVCVYTCPEHGEFDAEVQRDEHGNSPDVIPCPVETARYPGSDAEPDAHRVAWCALDATWTPVPIACRVRRVEVTRGKWEKPERPTYLDTRKLGEGQPIEEFRAERKKVWDEERRRKVRELLR